MGSRGGPGPVPGNGGGLERALQFATQDPPMIALVSQCRACGKVTVNLIPARNMAADLDCPNKDDGRDWVHHMQIVGVA